MRQEGRYLSGFGDATGPSGPGGDPTTADASVREMEADDDTYGSGVFDQPGSGPTANANLGVFATYNSLPGYIGREVPYAVSKDEFDATSDADIVGIPAGGIPLIGRSNVTPRAGSAITDTYVTLPPRPLPPRRGYALPGPDYQRVPSDPGNTWIRPVPQTRGAVVPPATAFAPVMTRQGGPLAAQPIPAGVPQRRLPALVTNLKSAFAARAPQPVISGFGADGGTSLLQYIVSGALLGAAGLFAYKMVVKDLKFGTREDRNRAAWAKR